MHDKTSSPGLTRNHSLINSHRVDRVPYPGPKHTTLLHGRCAEYTSPGSPIASSGSPAGLNQSFPLNPLAPIVPLLGQQKQPANILPLYPRTGAVQSLFLPREQAVESRRVRPLNDASHHKQRAAAELKAKFFNRKAVAARAMASMEAAASSGSSSSSSRGNSRVNSSSFKPRYTRIRDQLVHQDRQITAPQLRKEYYGHQREAFEMEEGLIAKQPNHNNQSSGCPGSKKFGDTSDAVEAAGISSKTLPGPLEILRQQPVLSPLLLFIPAAFAAHFLGWPPSVSFVLNFIAIVPQAWLMGKATEDLAGHLGQIAGGLLNAWFGNVVEMLLCIAGLRAGEMLVVKATLVGSILSNLLLVAGCAFLFGGFKHKVQEFSAIGASTNASLMTLSCLCLGLPTLYGTMHPAGEKAQLQMSRSVSFLLVFMYIQYLIFQLYTHSFLFENEDDEEEEADLSKWWAVGILGGCTVCCAFNSEFLISSIEGTEDSWNISKAFIGIILLPIIGNAAEHYTSVIVAMRNKMDLSLACAVGSSCQMALFVTPFTVLAGWVLGQPMSLDLHAFEMGVLLLAVLIVTSILQDGYSNWLEGSMLVSAYCVIALIYFFEDPAD